MTGGWNPSSLPGLVGWYAADDIASLVLSGANVTNWHDRSGAGNHLAYNLAQPTFGLTGLYGQNRPAVVWSASANDAGLVTASAVTVRQVGLVAAYTSGASSWTAGFQGLYSRTDLASTSEIGLAGDSSGANWLATNNYLTRNGAAEVQLTGGNAALPLPAAVLVARLAAAPTAGLRFLLGRDRMFTGRGWSGPISEVVAVSAALSTGDRQKLEGYLAWRWGLQGSLDAAHPYKSVRP